VGNIVDLGMPHMAISRMRILCWIPKSTNNHFIHVMLVAFPLRQWLHEEPQYYVIRILFVFFRHFVHLIENTRVIFSLLNILLWLRYLSG
jgi:hypothetical protein